MPASALVVVYVPPLAVASVRKCGTCTESWKFADILVLQTGRVVDTIPSVDLHRLECIKASRYAREQGSIGIMAPRNACFILGLSVC